MEHNKILKIIRNVIINLIIFILVIIAIITIWASIQLNVKNEEYINIFGYSVFNTETESMSPTIKKGDIVIVKIGESIQENDIITYKKENTFITHRILEIDEKSIITKGDNNNTSDEEITQDAIIGKVVYVVKNVEIWKKVFTDADVIVPIIISVILIIILISYKENKMNSKQTGEKND